MTIQFLIQGSQSFPLHHQHSAPTLLFATWDQYRIGWLWNDILLTTGMGLANDGMMEDKEGKKRGVVDSNVMTDDKADITATLILAQQEIQQSLPLLLYGSGASPSCSQDEVTTQALSAMTMNYISELCDAALRNHEAMVGPHAYIHSFENDSSKDGKVVNLSSIKGENTVAKILYPLEFGVDVRNDIGVDVDSSDVDDGKQSVSLNSEDDDNDIDRTDCLKIGPQSFIRSIMHDKIQYGRVKEIQAARISLSHDLLDHAILSAVKDEVGDSGTWPGTENILPLHE